MAGKEFDITVAMVGAGGDGVITAGETLASAAAHMGLHALVLKSFGPQIRGGESSCHVRMRPEKVECQADAVDVLVCFSWHDIVRFRDEIRLADDALVIADTADKLVDEPPIEIPGTYLKVPMKEIAAAEAGADRSRNFLALGLVAELLGLNPEGLVEASDAKYGKRRPQVAEANRKAITAGAAWAGEHRGEAPAYDMTFEPGEPRYLVSGNEAIALGAIHAGCGFYAGYPITPASEVLEYLSKYLPRFGGTVVQAEDEMAAINMVIGASFGGAKALCATSGPGLSLKQEALGLALMAELPLVLVNVQRGGPSTGIPTKMEQSDLMAAVYGGHGDAQRVVLAPIDAEDCFQVIHEAFYLSETYQIPVVVLSDGYIGQRKETVAKIAMESMRVAQRSQLGTGEGEFRRYDHSEPGGVSNTAWPGVEGGTYLASGIEHDERGWPTSSGIEHQLMTEKRYAKYEQIRDHEGPHCRHHGDEAASVGLLTWGSISGAVLEAVDRLRARGRKVAALVPRLINPLPEREIREFVGGVGQVLVVEQNFGRQFLTHLRGHVDHPGILDAESLSRVGGSIIAASEIVDKVESMFEATTEAGRSLALAAVPPRS